MIGKSFLFLVLYCKLACADFGEDFDGGLFGGSTTVHEERFEAQSKGAVFVTKTAPVYVVTEGDAILEGVTSSQRIHFVVPNGIVQLLARKDFYQESRTEKSSGTFMQSIVQDACSGTTYTPCDLAGGAIVESRDGILVETVKGKTLSWLSKIDAGDHPVIQRELEEHFASHHFEAEGPTLALAAVITLAVTIATSGAGASLGAAVAGVQAGATATVAQGFVISATQAAFTGLCSQGAVALVAHGGNIGKAAQDLTKGEALRSLVMAAGSAGLVKGVGIAAGVPTSALAASEKGLVGHLQRQLVTQGVTAAVSMAFGARPEDALRGAALGAAAGTVGGIGANHISAAYSQGILDAVTHKLAHAGMGALGGAILSGEKGIIGGAMGAFVAETFADAFSPEKPMEKVKALEAEKGRPLTSEEFTTYYRQELETYGRSVSAIEDWSKVVGATAALLTGQDVTTAAATATIAVENNFALLAYYGVVAAGIAYSAYEVYSAYEEGGPVAALKQLGIEVVADVAGAAALRAGGKIAYKLGSAVYPTVEAAVGAALERVPGLKTALGSMVDKIVAAGEVIGSSALGRGVARAEAALGRMEAKVAEKVGMGNKKQVTFTDDAKMPSAAVKLRTELALKDAGILDAEGKLTRHALEKSELIELRDGVIKNPEVREILTRDGSSISDWQKYYTPTATMPNGQRVQVHYYRNDVTGKIDYVTRDFKVSGEIK